MDSHFQSSLADRLMLSYDCREQMPVDSIDFDLGYHIWLFSLTFYSADLLLIKLQSGNPRRALMSLALNPVSPLHD